MIECVVRMEIPNGCHDCKLRNMIGNCPIPMFDGQNEEKIWTLAERPPWCPIICSLPEGHGRLVDASSKIMVPMGEDGEPQEMTIDSLLDYVVPFIDSAVPAERRETEQI